MSMTRKKCLKVLKLYERDFRGRFVEGKAKKFPEREMLPVNPRKAEKAAVRHVLSMIPEMKVFLAKHRREKFMRWLGFIQGSLWALGVYSLEDLKNHNRPDTPSS